MNDPSREQLDPSLPLRTVALRSWWSMKTWVMVWLWYLNVLYWVGFFYLARPEAFWAIMAYLAVGPFVIALVSRQRGLTRLTGLIHLPWVPLLVYLWLRLFTDGLGPAPTPAGDPLYYFWIQLVFWSTLVCVALDIVDVMRWLAGERYVLGSPAAAAAGASKLAPR